MTIQYTVGICAYNEDKNIEQLLESLSKQGLPDDYEVLIVCSGCTDKTIEIAQAYAEKDHRIKILVEAKRNGKASAVNQVLDNAQGSTIVFVSADTLPHDGCFSNLFFHLSQANSIGLVCGKPVPTEDTNSRVDRLVQLLWLFHDHVFKELSDSGIARHASEVFALRKEAAEKLMEGIVNDDAYLAVMAKCKGWSIKYESKAIVTITGPKTFREYFQQRRRIIFGHYQIKKVLGIPPQYLVYLFPLYPKRTIKLVTWLISRYGLVSFSIFAAIELMLNGLAIVEFSSGKSYSNWPTCESTKTISLK